MNGYELLAVTPDDTEQRIPQHEQEAKFYELVELACDVCGLDFDAITSTEEPKERSPEALLVMQLGLFGLRSAHHGLATAEQCDDPVRYPEAYSNPANPKVLDVIERFGKAYIESMFQLLGPVEATARAEAVRASTDTSGKVVYENILWLIGRIGKIQERHKQQDTPFRALDKSRSEYHPIKLSARFLHDTPDGEPSPISPSCLGASAIVASFLERAGIEYVHMGVAMKANTYARRRVRSYARVTIEKSEQTGLALNEKELKALQDTIEKQEAIINNPEEQATHATVAAFIPGLERWMIVDPYLGSMKILGPGRGNSFDETVRFVQSMDEIGIPIEMVDRNDASFFTGVDACEALFDVIEHEPRMTDDELDTFLLGDRPNITIEELSRVLLEPLFNAIDGSEGARYDALRDTLSALAVKLRTPDVETLVTTLATSIIRDKLFDGDIAKGRELSDCLAKCRRDAEYRATCVKDLHGALLLTGYRMVALEANIALQHKYPEGYGHQAGAYETRQELFEMHNVVEVGMPHHRIGASVLNDFAQFFAPDISADFWAAHWTSEIASYSHYNNTLDRGSEGERTRILGRLIDTYDMLRYAPSDVIIE